jgi:uncharacterized Zn-binding protein involved in type VI secretion
MGLPAARATDMAGHGGPITLGSITVLIGGMPAARVGDLFVCPGVTGIVPHIMGNIVMGSTTVMIDGSFAARMGDITGCNVAGVSGKGMPPVVTPGVPGSFSNSGQVAGSPNAGLLWGQHSGYKNANGQQDILTGSVGHLQGEKKIGDTTFSGSANAYTGTLEGHEGKGGQGATAGGSVYNAQGQMTNKDGSSQSASGSIGNANANYEYFLGDDGRRTGVGVGAVAQASVAEGQIDSTDVYKLPFGYDLKVKKTGGLSYESIGAAAATGLYKDKADNRHHFMWMLDAEFLIGGKAGMDVSFGKAASSSSGGGPTGIGIASIPGTVLTGLPTVLIG